MVRTPIQSVVVDGHMLRVANVVLVSLAFGILLGDLEVDEARRMEAILDMDDFTGNGTVDASICMRRTSAFGGTLTYSNVY